MQDGKTRNRTKAAKRDLLLGVGECLTGSLLFGSIFYPQTCGIHKKNYGKKFQRESFNNYGEVKNVQKMFKPRHLNYICDIFRERRKKNC